MAAGELKRFSDKFGATELIDRESRAFQSAGLGYMRLGPDEAFERVLRDQGLLRLPLVRSGWKLSVGVAEKDWLAWLKGDQ